ncbi:MAG: cytochrome-c peroxidase [Planctomycetaceae bacterium]
MRTHLIGILGISVLFGVAAAGSRGGGRGEALTELGRRLFMDPTVSGSGKFSCASCHEPEHGFSDPRVLSEDVGGTTRRRSQPLLDLEQGKGFHWDGEFGSVRELVFARLAPPQEAVAQSFALHQRRFGEALDADRRPDKGEFDRTVARLVPPYYGPPAPTTPGPVPVVAPLLARLGEDDRYARGFAEAFGSGSITTERFVAALEAYLRTLRSAPNALDRFLGSDPEALLPAARRGLALFSGKASCASCHSLEGPGGGAPHTDGKFHDTGVSMRTVLLAFQGSSGADGGRGEMSFVADDLGTSRPRASGTWRGGPPTCTTARSPRWKRWSATTTAAGRPTDAWRRRCVRSSSPTPRSTTWSPSCAPSTARRGPVWGRRRIRAPGACACWISPAVPCAGSPLRSIPSATASWIWRPPGPPFAR